MDLTHPHSAAAHYRCHTLHFEARPVLQLGLLVQLNLYHPALRLEYDHLAGQSLDWFLPCFER
jgi:hypothetical protein